MSDVIQAALPSQNPDILGFGSPSIEHNMAVTEWSRRGVFGFNSRDSRSRTFNLLRNQLVTEINNSGARIISLTSATPNVGKSFIAANLAASLSRLKNCRTLLFDLDLRRGTIANTFNITGDQGLESYLSGEIDTLAGHAVHLPDTHLNIYPCFLKEMHSAELLSSDRMIALVAAMRALPSDVICLIDLPPVFANDDASIVTRMIDGYIFVAEEGVTTARQVTDSLHLMEPCKCIGSVLNRYKGNFGNDTYGFGYGTERKYSSYYS